jgi:Phage tail assembly chaperone proteins, E, or 41 or 14
MSKASDTPTDKNTDKNTITLATPVTIDGEKVSKVTLRKPTSGELRGLNLANIMQMDVSTMIRLLPRITTPPLSEGQVAALEPEDLMDMASRTVVFFARKDQLALLQV